MLLEVRLGTLGVVEKGTDWGPGPSPMLEGGPDQPEATPVLEALPGWLISGGESREIVVWSANDCTKTRVLK